MIFMFKKKNEKKNDDTVKVSVRIGKDKQTFICKKEDVKKF